MASHATGLVFDSWLMQPMRWNDGGWSISESTDRHALLFAGLGFSHLLDGPRINGPPPILLSLDLLLTDSCWWPVQTAFDQCAVSFGARQS